MSLTDHGKRASISEPLMFALNQKTLCLALCMTLKQRFVSCMILQIQKTMIFIYVLKLILLSEWELLQAF